MIQKTYTDCGCVITVYGDGSASPDVEYCDTHYAALKTSERTKRAIEQYTALKLDIETRGSTQKIEWEDARSYAVEALTGLLYDNPEAFRYASDMSAILDARKISK